MWMAHGWVSGRGVVDVYRGVEHVGKQRAVLHASEVKSIHALSDDDDDASCVGTTCE